MKKILLATTMLTGTAGFAAAEVAVSGYAEIGILAADTGIAGVGTVTTFHQDVEVTFSMSGETDGGLSFGAKIDLDETNVALLDDSGTTVFVSGAFGTLTMGDTDGAFDWAIQDAGSLTSMGDDHTTHLDYFAASGFDASHDNQVVRYEYSFGDFGVAVSFEQASQGISGFALDDNIGIGATYTMDMAGTALRFGLAYQRGSDVTATTTITTGAGSLTITGVGTAGVNGDIWGLSVGAEFAGGFSGVIGYSKKSLDGVAGNEEKLGLGVTYTTGALSVHANYGETDSFAGVKTDSYGLAVNYDLGGGAVVMAGYGSDVRGAGQGQYSVGLGLSF